MIGGGWREATRRACGSGELQAGVKQQGLHLECWSQEQEGGAPMGMFVSRGITEVLDWIMGVAWRGRKGRDAWACRTGSCIFYFTLCTYPSPWVLLICWLNSALDVGCVVFCFPISGSSVLGGQIRPGPPSGVCAKNKLHLTPRRSPQPCPAGSPAQRSSPHLFLHLKGQQS